MEYCQMQKLLQRVKDQLIVIDRFKQCVGTTHPHLNVLQEAEKELSVQVEALVCRKAERPQASFSILSNTVRQFRAGKGFEMLSLVASLAAV